MDTESVSKRYEEMKKEVGRVNGPKFYKKHLLNSVNESLARKDLDAINSMHKYFDYNLNFIDLHGSKPSHPVKVHQPELNLANLQLRLGQIDQALLAVLETIRISQNKNDHEAILQCLVLLQQIRRVLGRGPASSASKN